MQNFNRIKTGFREKVNSSQGRFLVWSITYLVVFLFFLSLYLNRMFQPIALDEPQFIWLSQRFTLLILDGNFKSNIWSKPYNNWGRINPKVSLYFMAVPLMLSHEIYTDFPAMQWDPNLDVDGNDRLGTTPPFRTLFYGRLANPFLVAASVCLCLFLLSRCLSPVPSLLASLFLGLSPLWYKLAVIARLDIPAFFLSMAFLAWASAIDWRKLSAKSRAQEALALIFSGCILGLCIGAKINALPLLGVWCAYLFWMICLDFQPIKMPGLKRLPGFVYAVVLSLGVGWVVFVASNPFLYSLNPIITLQHAHILLLNSNCVYSSREVFPQDALYTNWERIKSVPSLMFESPGWDGGLLAKSEPGIYGLFLAGAVLLLARILRGLANQASAEYHGLRKKDVAILLLLSVALIYIPSQVWIPLKWLRYYLPFLIPFAILFGAGCEAVVSLLRSGLRRFLRNPS